MSTEIRDQEPAEPHSANQMNVGRFLVFLFVELLLAPLSLVGMIAFLVKLKRDNQPKGISGTAYEPHWMRVLAHCVGTRSDECAYRLSQALPASSALITNLVAQPTAIAARISGYVPTLLSRPDKRPLSIMSMMGSRTAFFDDALENAQGDVQQVVILGSGWDTRAYEALRGWPNAIFEVDLPATLEAKINALDNAGIDRTHVTYVATDFDQTNWLAALQADGFDPDLRTFILWEGVTMYVSEDAIRATLTDVAGLAPGSRIAFDYFSREFINGEGRYRMLAAYAKFAIKLTYNEQFIFGVPMQPIANDAIAEFVFANGLAMDRFDMVGEDGGWSAVYGFASARTK